MSDCTLYGIPNCDKVRAARKWLEQRGIACRFHDLRKDGLDATLLQQWLNQTGLETLVNRRSATWRQLDETTRAAILGGDLARLTEYPTLIKRPLLVHNGTLLVGFDPEPWEAVMT